MAEVYSWIKNIVIFMILNSIIMNLLGNKSYKKYVSIVSGMILVLIVIYPVMKLMKLDDNLDYYIKANDYSAEAADFKNDLSRVEADQRDVIFAEYEDKIKGQVKQTLNEEGVTLKTLHITIDQDVNSSTFGEITGMTITAKAGISQGKDGTGGLNIDEIDIPDITIGNGDGDKEKRVPSPLEISIKNKIADFYNMEQGNININIQGG